MTATPRGAFRFSKDAIAGLTSIARTRNLAAGRWCAVAGPDNGSRYGRCLGDWRQGDRWRGRLIDRQKFGSHGSVGRGRTISDDPTTGHHAVVEILIPLDSRANGIIHGSTAHSSTDEFRRPGCAESKSRLRASSKQPTPRRFRPEIIRRQPLDLGQTYAGRSRPAEPAKG